MVGMNMNMVNMRNEYVVKERINEVRGIKKIRENDDYIYLRVKEKYMCMGGYEKNKIVMEKVKKEFELSVYEMEWIVLRRKMSGEVNMINVFENDGIKGKVCGEEGLKKEKKNIIGEDKRLNGMFKKCG
jgi:hypothetical protein